MNFYDTVTEMGYKLTNLDGILDISMDYDGVTVHIVFYTQDKKIIGFVEPQEKIYDIDDMSHLYKVFLNMQKDLKFFAEKSNYDII